MRGRGIADGMRQRHCSAGPVDDIPPRRRDDSADREPGQRAVVACVLSMVRRPVVRRRGRCIGSAHRAVRLARVTDVTDVTDMTDMTDMIDVTRLTSVVLVMVVVG